VTTAVLVAISLTTVTGLVKVDVTVAVVVAVTGVKLVAVLVTVEPVLVTSTNEVTPTVLVEVLV
jgi:hypothetical protein